MRIELLAIDADQFGCINCVGAVFKLFGGKLAGFEFAGDGAFRAVDGFRRLSEGGVRNCSICRSLNRSIEPRLLNRRGSV